VNAVESFVQSPQIYNIGVSSNLEDEAKYINRCRFSRQIQTEILLPLTMSINFGLTCLLTQGGLQTSALLLSGTLF